MINPLIRETISTPIPETTGGLNITITEVIDSNDEVVKEFGIVIPENIKRGEN